MGEVAQEIGVSRATLYRHFPTRDDLLRELALEAVRVTDEAVAHIGIGIATYEQAFALMFEALVPIGDRYHFLSNEAWLLSDEVVAREVTRQARSTAALVQGAQAAGEIDPSLPASYVTRQFDAAIYVAWSTVEGEELETAEAVRLGMRTFWRGVRSDSN